MAMAWPVSCSCEELLLAQSIPLFGFHTVAGFTKPPINFSECTYSAMRRMAGNSFNQSCASTLFAYVISQVECEP